MHSAWGFFHVLRCHQRLITLVGIGAIDISASQSAGKALEIFDADDLKLTNARGGFYLHDVTLVLSD